MLGETRNQCEGGKFPRIEPRQAEKIVAPLLVSPPTSALISSVVIIAVQAFETLAREVLKKNDRAEPAKSSGVKVTDQPSNNNGQQKGCCK